MVKWAITYFNLQQLWHILKELAYQLNFQRQNLERQIADRKAQIAILTSAAVMEQRARDMGFERINPSDAVYVAIPGYTGKQ